MELETNIIFLDTSIFENENFFKSYKIQRLAGLSREGFLKVKITQITYDEVKNRIKKRVEEGRIAVKKFQREIDNKSKILKNLPRYSLFYDFEVDSSKDFNDLVIHFDEWINYSDVEIIGLEKISINEVMEQYWNKKAPFGDGQKKDEFPDAFAINIIHHWAKDTGSKVYVISSDKDFSNYEDDTSLIITDNLVELIESATAMAIGERRILTTINSIKTNLSIINYALKENYSEDLSGLFYSYFSDRFEDLEIDVIDISNVILGDVSILETSQDEANVELNIYMSIQLSILYGDYGFAIYDKEDGRYYGVESESFTSDLDIKITCNGLFSIEWDEEEIFDIELNSLDTFKLQSFKDKTKDDFFKIEQYPL